MPGNRRDISKLILLLGCLLSVALLIGGLRRLPGELGWGRYGLGPPVHIADLQRVRDRTHLSLPSDAVLEDGYEQEAGMSCWFIARMRLPHPRVHAFLAQSRPHSDVQDKEIDYQFQSGFQWMREQHWPIPNPHKFQSTNFTGTSDPASGCAVLVDLDDPKTAIAYLYFYY